MILQLVSHTRIDEITGDMVRLRARGAAMGEPNPLYVTGLPVGRVHSERSEHTN